MRNSYLLSKTQYEALIQTRKERDELQKKIVELESKKLESKKKESDVSLAFVEALAKQNEKGMKKYGQALDPLDPRYDWLKMAIEEQVDGFQYLYAELIKRKFVIKEIKAIMPYKVHPLVYDKVIELLGILEGES